MKDSLVIIGGSGSLTDNKNSIGYDKIYPSLIENNIKDLELYNLSKPGNDVTEALKGLDESLHKIKPSFAIIDLGLVDCSPRVFSRKRTCLSIDVARIFAAANIWYTEKASKDSHKD
jgi:hypothetical protein